MILAGDIGGTKTNLAIFTLIEGQLQPIRSETFSSRDHGSLEEILSKFLLGGPSQIEAACFGVAGPIIAGRCITPNLPWVIDSAELARSIGTQKVLLMNDLEATAYGTFELGPREVFILNEGEAMPGNMAIVAAGTGFGVAAIYWDGSRHIISASEGGHVNFAPRNRIEIELLEYLLREHDRVSLERVVSGPGLFAIYRFLRDSGYGQETPSVAAEFAIKDPSSVISSAALSGLCHLSIKALDMFVSLYGAAAGDVALMLKAIGGVYIGGGIAPKILEKLKDGSFMRSFTEKGRLTPLLERMPVRVVLNDKAALIGAARAARSLLLG
jgi:glucokinase